MARGPKRTAQITIRVPPSFKEAAEQAAKRDSRPLSSLIEKLLRDHMARVGINPDDLSNSA